MLWKQWKQRYGWRLLVARSSWRSWRSEPVPVRSIRAFFPRQPTEFRLGGGLYTNLLLRQFTKSRQTEAVWSALVVDPLASLVYRIGSWCFRDLSFLPALLGDGPSPASTKSHWTERVLRSLQSWWGGTIIPCRDKQFQFTEENPIQVCPSVCVITTAHISQLVMGSRKVFSILVSHINIASM